VSEDRDSDKKYYLVPQKESGKARHPVSVDVVKSAFIAEGLTVEEISSRYFLSQEIVQKVVADHKLQELRNAYIRQGIAKIQNVQLGQAQELLDVELGFKKMRLVQLQSKLQDYMAYYARHNDFYKRHPVTGDILKDTDGIPMQLNIPNVAREINQLKESVTLSEGLKKLMSDLDSLINSKPEPESIDGDGDVIDMEEVDKYFRKKV